MNNIEFGWEALLMSDAPSGYSLKAGLFTTYDRPDERLLAEHLLPMLLKLNREPVESGREKQYFLLELDRRLKQLHGQLVVVSTTVREESADASGAQENENGGYGWIWRSIRQLTVGCEGNAVQHAKLWLLHWGAVDGQGAEYIELVISSANLTLAAFRGQLQAVWRTCIKLESEPNKMRLKSWGVVPEFLRKLASSTGNKMHLDPFLDLLKRADCPDGVTFVASIPGKHSSKDLRRTPWGSAGLREITPLGRGKVNSEVLCPFIGSWSAAALKNWCASFGGTPQNLKIVWIDKDHKWAKQWVLPEESLKIFNGIGATLIHLQGEGDDSTFHDEHHDKDTRWSHAKVYFLRKGTSCRLLVTSANFSQSAWGRVSPLGEVVIKNFEIGVCVDQGVWPFGNLGAFDAKCVPATVLKLENTNSSLITWAQAVWDGKRVVIQCRCDTTEELIGKIKSTGTSVLISEWSNHKSEGFRTAIVNWQDEKSPPSLVKLTCGSETIVVTIFDDRPPRDRENTLPSEVDEDLAQSIRDQLLFEQYGGHFAVDTDDDESNIENQEQMQTFPEEDESGTDEVGVGRLDSYAVPAFELARRHLGVVDNWVNQVTRMNKLGWRDFDLQQLRHDGEMLIEGFQRQAKRDVKRGLTSTIGARLAAEELALRLKTFPEL